MPNIVYPDIVLAADTVNSVVPLVQLRLIVNVPTLNVTFFLILIAASRSVALDSKFALRAQKVTAKMQKQITITNIEHRNALLIKKGEDE